MSNAGNAGLTVLACPSEREKFLRPVEILLLESPSLRTSLVWLTIAKSRPIKTIRGAFRFRGRVQLSSGIEMPARGWLSLGLGTGRVWLSSVPSQQS